MLFIGIDLGTSAVKLVLMNEKGEIFTVGNFIEEVISKICSNEQSYKLFCYFSRRIIRYSKTKNSKIDVSYA